MSKITPWWVRRALVQVSGFQEDPVGIGILLAFIQELSPFTPSSQVCLRLGPLCSVPALQPPPRPFCPGGQMAC